MVTRTIRTHRRYVISIDAVIIRAVVVMIVVMRSTWNVYCGTHMARCFGEAKTADGSDELFDYFFSSIFLS